MNDIIELNNENLDGLNYEDVIAVTIAEGGAMGEPNSFYAITKEYKLYHLNFVDVDISKEQLKDAFPLLKTFNCFCENVQSIETGWNWFNMGFGNYLIVREEYYKKVKEYIEKNMSENWEHGELYNKWYEVIKNVCK